MIETLKQQKHFLKEPMNFVSEAHQKYWEYVTPYAYKNLRGQILNVKNYQNVVETAEKGVFEIRSQVTDEVKYVTTNTTCTCRYTHSMKLPCAHIFKVRALLHEPVFDRNLIAE